MGEDAMRTPLFVMMGAMLLTAPAAPAAPINAPAIGEAADQIQLSETVHCRPFRHWHRWGYGRGCGGGVVIYGPRVHSRVGVRFRDHYDTRIRSGVAIRGEERTTIRGGTTRERTMTRDNNAVRGGVAGESTPRGGVTGGQVREGGGRASRDGGSMRPMNSAPAAQQGSQGTSAGGGGGGGSQGR
jgi:hypothetical protein